MSALVKLATRAAYKRTVHTLGGGEKAKTVSPPECQELISSSSLTHMLAALRAAVVSSSVRGPKAVVGNTAYYYQAYRHLSISKWINSTQTPHSPSLSTSRTPKLPTSARHFHASSPTFLTLNQSMRRKPLGKKRSSKSPALEGCYQKKGVCVSVFTRKPKKPNSGERRVARVKLSTGKTVDCYIPGEGHNLQEHSVVLVRGGRAQDLPGVR